MIKKDFFIHELRLRPTPEQSKLMDIRLDVARQLYNSCLGEVLRRLKKLKDSKLYKLAQRTSTKKIKNKKFREARDAVSFTEYSLHKYLTKTYSNSWLTKYVDSLSAQKIATRAFKAAEQYAFGKRGRPRFKSKNRFLSIEGKNNSSGIRLIDEKIIWSTKGGNKVVLKPIYDLKDKDGLEKYALSCNTKYVRLIRKSFNVWYAQLVQEGLSYLKPKHKLGSGTVGLDIGPSTIAMVGDSEANLEAFCTNVEDYRKDISKIQKRMSRSLREGNSDNFENGVIKKNTNIWYKSKRYQILRKKVAELQRKMAATRKRDHGSLVNKILGIGKFIKTEKLSYRSFQKNFGRSVGFRAPGLFLNKLRYKAESAGGEVVEFKTRSTMLSQICQCGYRKKKKLKERWHRCGNCGIYSQRDLYSAFLARYVIKDRLDISQAQKAWVGVGTLLKQAMSKLNETAIGKIRFASFGLGQSQSGLSVKEESV